MSLPYALLNALSNRAGRLFYRSIRLTYPENSGPYGTTAESLPEGGLVVMANHSYHMNDSSTMQAILGRRDVYYVAYSTLYQGLLLGWLYNRLPEGNLRDSIEAFEDKVRYALLRSIHLTPIHRAQDGKTDHKSRKENFALLDAAAKKAAEGHVIVIYPDGGSPDGYQHDQVLNGSAHLAVRAAQLAKDSGQTVNLVCLGTTHGSYHEPLYSDIEVRLALIENLSHWIERTDVSLRKLRKDLAALIQRKIREQIVIAPPEMTRAIELISGILRSEKSSQFERTSKAASMCRYLAEFEPEEWNTLGQLLATYDVQSWNLRVSPGDERMVNATGAREVTTALAAQAATWLYAIPLFVIGRMTKDRPEALHLRGQQMLGTASAIMVLWLSALGVLDYELIVHDQLSALAGVTLASGYTAAGLFANKYFWWARVILLRTFDRVLFRHFEETSDQIVSFLDSHPKSEVEQARATERT